MTDQTIADMGACTAYLGDSSEIFDCDCCQTSQLISNIFNICPNSNLSSIGFTDWFANEEKTIQNAQAFNLKLTGKDPGNCTILDTAPDTCVSKYKLPIQGTKWWNPLELPADVPGTEALSDTAGSVTVPPWGMNKSSMVLFPGYTTVITPAAYNAKNAAATTGVGDTTIAGATTGMGTGSAGAAATTTKASSGNAVLAGRWGVGVIAVAVSGMLSF